MLALRSNLFILLNRRHNCFSHQFCIASTVPCICNTLPPLKRFLPFCFGGNTASKTAFAARRQICQELVHVFIYLKILESATKFIQTFAFVQDMTHPTRILYQPLRFFKYIYISFVIITKFITNNSFKSTPTNHHLPSEQFFHIYIFTTHILVFFSPSRHTYFSYSRNELQNVPK